MDFNLALLRQTFYREIVTTKPPDYVSLARAYIERAYELGQHASRADDDSAYGADFRAFRGGNGNENESNPQT